MRIIKAQPETDHHDRLRLIAEARGGEGSVSLTKGGGTLGLDALETLYRRASNPESAADALKLLHELQTHQVEVDLLFEQLQANEHEIAEDLAYYKSLYEDAPMAYLVVASDGRVIESNNAAGLLFGSSPAHLLEQPVAALLTPLSRATLAEALQALEVPDSNIEFTAELRGGPDAGRTEQLLVNARRVTAGDNILMVFPRASDVLTTTP
jgi:PAS domain S-box-containing protein